MRSGLAGGLALQDALKHRQWNYGDLRFVASGQDDWLPEQAHLGGELGEVRAGLCDAQVTEFGHVHALRIQESWNVHQVGLYNSGMGEKPKTPTTSLPSNMHETCRHLAYRMTCEQYENLLAESGGECQACGTPAAETSLGKLVIDHDYDYGNWAVRGLICQGCNAQLRYDRPDPAWAADYLARPWFQAELARRALSADCPPEPVANSVRSFDGKNWYRTTDGLWTHGFKRARRMSWRRLFYEFGPWGLVTSQVTH